MVSLVSRIPKGTLIHATSEFRLLEKMACARGAAKQFDYDTNSRLIWMCTQASTNYKEAFALFDKRGNGRVALASLGDLLRACGQNPTLAEISELEKSVGGDCECDLLTSTESWQAWLMKHIPPPVDFDSFQKVLNRPGGFRDPGEPEEYCRGFQVFDKDMTGFIGVGQLRYSTCDGESEPHDGRFAYVWKSVLTNLGEKMNDEEVDELLKAVDTTSGEINYTGRLGFYCRF
ncbi:MAG: hypothetical protein Q9212_006542 [Teloschistes hypoglaucus]